MKKLILALAALGFAFAISSCGDRGCFTQEKTCKQHDKSCPNQHSDDLYSDVNQRQNNERPSRRW